MQHETSTFPASLGDPFEYPMTSSYQNKGWSSFGELEFEINPCSTLNMIDEEERTNSVFNSMDSSSDASCPQFSSVSNGLNASSSTLSIDGNILTGDNGQERVGPSWYHDNVDINELLGDDLKFEPINTTTITASLPFSTEASSSSSDDASKVVLSSPEDQLQQSNKFIATNAANITPLLVSSPPPLSLSLLTKTQEVNKKRKKNEDDQEKEKKKKEVTKKKKTQTQVQIQQEIEEFNETDNEDSGCDNSGTQPKLTRKEKNKIAAQKYRAKQRNEASDVAKRCEKFVSENAQLRGEIETTRKQIEEYKMLLAQLNSPNGFF